MFIRGQVNAITGTGSACLAEAESGIVKVIECGDRDRDGVLADDDGDRLDIDPGHLAILAAIVGVIVDADEVFFREHEFMFGRIEVAGPDGDLDVLSFKGHKIIPIVFDRQAVEWGFANAFIDTGQYEGGDFGTKSLVLDLGEVVLLATVVGKVEVLGPGGEGAEGE